MSVPHGQVPPASRGTARLVGWVILALLLWFGAAFLAILIFPKVAQVYGNNAWRLPYLTETVLRLCYWSAHYWPTAVLAGLAGHALTTGVYAFARREFRTPWLGRWVIFVLPPGAILGLMAAALVALLL